MAKKIKICGKQRTLTFGLLAIETYCEKMGGDIEQLDKIFHTSDLIQVKAIATLIWSALVASCELYGEDFDFSLNQVKQELGDMEQDVFDSIMEEFKRSRWMGKTIADYYYAPVEQEVADKKKSAPKKS